MLFIEFIFIFLKESEKGISFSTKILDNTTVFNIHNTTTTNNNNKYKILIRKSAYYNLREDHVTWEYISAQNEFK